MIHNCCAMRLHLAEFWMWKIYHKSAAKMAGGAKWMVMAQQSSCQGRIFLQYCTVIIAYPNNHIWPFLSGTLAYPLELPFVQTMTPEIPAKQTTLLFSS